MNKETKFEVGDTVEWCGKQGTVTSIDYNCVWVSFKDIDPGFLNYYNFQMDGKLYRWHTEPSLKLISKAKKKRKVKLYAYLCEVRNCLGDDPKYFEQLSYRTVKMPDKRVPELDKEVEIEE